MISDSLKFVCTVDLNRILATYPEWGGNSPHFHYKDYFYYLVVSRLINTGVITL